MPIDKAHAAYVSPLARKKKKKTCPEGEKLVDGICVPIEKPKEKPSVPVSDKWKKAGYATPEEYEKKEIAKILSEGGRKARTKEELMTPEERAKEQIREDPAKFGLQRPGEEIVKPESVEIIEGERKEVRPGEFIDGVRQIEPGPVESLKESAQKALAFAGQPVPTALLAGVPGGFLAWKVGGKLLFNSKKAVQTATAAKHSSMAKPILSGFAKYAVGGYALLKGVEGVASYFTGRKIDEQQQALNTLGQITSSIVGDSKTSAGDYTKGLQELRYIKQEVLRLEAVIKAGSIANAAVKFNGKIYDINADIYDQLATIDEGIRDLQDFALMGAFPELDEFEMQGYLRELEEEGYIEPVDLTAARRETRE